MNREVREANALPGGDDLHEGAEAEGGVVQSPPFSTPSGKSPDTDPLGESTAPKRTPYDVTMGSDTENPFVTRYQTLAMALSNPHRARPTIDLFV